MIFLFFYLDHCKWSWSLIYIIFLVIFHSPATNFPVYMIHDVKFTREITVETFFHLFRYGYVLHVAAANLARILNKYVCLTLVKNPLGEGLVMLFLSSFIEFMIAVES